MRRLSFSVMMVLFVRMDIEKFLAIPQWSTEPNLYIVLQDGGVKQHDGTFRQNRTHRCGAAGLHLYKDADLPFGSENTQSIGLRGRLFQYIGDFNPLGSKIIACLKIKRHWLRKHRIE
jgi:hypothetical protein